MSTSEKHIETSQYLNEWHRLRENLLQTNGWLKNEIKDFLDQFEITLQQYNILRILKEADGEPLSTNEICEMMIDKMSDSSRIVDRIISKGLAKKNKCPHDGRKIQVFITPEGENLLSTIGTKLKNLDASFNQLSIDEASKLNELLEKLRS
jgi:DNA-binding MarR family transcriptional regulator